MEKNHDLTEGVIWKKLAFFFLPILGGSLFQQLYTVVDAIIIGQFAGKEALASIDAVHSLVRLPVNFFSGLSTAAAIIISQYLGAKNNAKLSPAVHTAAAFAFTGGVLLSAMGAALSPLCLRALRVPAGIYASSLAYVRIYFAGMAASMTYNIGAGILRAAGNSKTPFYFLIAANLTNVLLDLLFVGAFRWGSAGAAFATVCAQFLSMALILAALTHTTEPYKLTLNKIRFHSEILKKIFFLGAPIGVQSSVYPAANMLIQSRINTFGVNSIAAWAVCGKLDFILWVFVDALGSAVSTFAAQNFGAGFYARARRGALVCCGISLSFMLAVSAALYALCEILARLFVSDSQVIALSVSLMRFLSPLYFLYSAGEVLSGTIRGTGETLKPMILTLTGTCACRIIWILAVVPHSPALKTVILSYPVSWGLTSLLFIVFYQFYKQKILPMPTTRGISFLN